MGNYCILIALLLLAGCARLPTYAEAQATARAGGCWPSSYPTPTLVTVTPAAPGEAPLPTATPFRPCPPAPDATAVVWPTPVPPPPAHPTIAGKPWQTGSDRETTLHLPSAVLAIDLPTHPTENWAAIGTVVWSGNEDPERAFVSVYHPQSRRWSPAHQVDVGDAQLGRYSRSVAVAIGGDQTVHAVWGMSDPDFADNEPPSGIWASASQDYGATWAPPQRIAADCRTVNDLAATLDGRLIALLICHDGPDRSVPALVMRQPDGTWLPPERLSIPVWHFSDGALVIVGEGSEAHAIGLLFAGQGGVAQGYLLRTPLASPAPTQIERLRLDPPPEVMLSERMWHVRGLVFERPGTMQPAITFTWTAADAGGAYAMSSLDAGQSWGALEHIAAPRTSDEQLVFAVPAYDPAADRLVAVWTCCGFAQFSVVDTTHHASWSVPGSGIWQPDTAAPRVPLVLGAAAAFETVSAQARNSRMAWLAWIERRQQVQIRSLDLNQVIPVDEYPRGDRP